MHTQIDKLALKAVNQVLKPHGIKIIKSSDNAARLIIQRSRIETYTQTRPRIEHRQGVWAAQVAGQKVVRHYAVGLAYGEALLTVLKNPSLRTNNVVGANGWYGMRQVMQADENYTPPVFDEETLAMLEEILP